MDNRCDYSQMTIPNDPSYVPVVQAYVGAAASRLGFDSHDREMIERGVVEAVRNVIKHAYEPHERATFDVSCERVPLGLKIVIADRGVPFDPEHFVVHHTSSDPATGSTAGSGLSLMREFMDEVQFHNLGHQGKETVLIKYLKNRTLEDYYEACDLELYSPPVHDGSRLPAPAGITVRAMQPEEALEVSRCVYRAYGYSYTYEHLYFPERIVELNKAGTLLSAVAVTSDNEVAGHIALIRHDATSRIAEIGMAAVKPRFRSRGIFTRLTEFILAQARSQDLMGILGRAVTNHTYSQQVALKAGLRDCGITLGLVPATASFKGITEKLPQRDATVLHFMYLNDPLPVRIFVPPHHEDVILRLYANLRARPEPEKCRALELPPRASKLRTFASTAMGYARINVEQYGQDVVTRVKDQLKELRLKRLEVIHLYLDLTDPLTCRLVEEFERLGFFFAGILPGGCTGDALILQYLNNVAVDYARISVKSDIAADLLEYVKEHDPNR